jgi:hypothetical protein
MPVEPGDWSSVPVALAEQQTRQFVTLYRALADFDDAAIQSPITCPRLCFAGSADEITYGQDWGGVVVSIGPALAREREGLEALGWEVLLLDGLDHMGAMQAAAVLPILRPWLAAAMGTR